MKHFIWFVVLLAAVSAVSAQQNHLKLLAVTEFTNGSYQGAVADLYVEVHPGTGRVFMDTYPLSRIDTQISTRFAKEIACEYSTKDCSTYDFFYTIRSTSAIIAGPSAGAALSTLTLATLEGFPVDESVSITGTINSGGLVGPVSGVKEKIQAGADAGLTTILIPIGDSVGDNGTLNITEYSRQLGVKVIPVIELDDAILYITGKPLAKREVNFSVDPHYNEIMRSLADDLCSRSAELERQAAEKVNASTMQVLRNASARGKAAFNDTQYYAAASYCFGANVRYASVLLASQNLSAALLREQQQKLQYAISDAYLNIPPYNTISDLETFALVLERITEAQKTLNESRTLLEEGNLDGAVRSFAFARERLRSAQSWSLFFNFGGKKIEIGRQDLEQSCIAKLAEAEERIQYVRLFIPEALSQTRDELNSAYADLREGTFDVCLFKSSRAKAEADAVLSSFGVGDGQLDDIIAQKRNAVRTAIARQTGKGNFPLAGYSYYEYANSLAGFDAPSSLLFYEYALELSNLDLYFKNASMPPPVQPTAVPISWKVGAGLLFVGGLLLGLVLGIVLSRPKKRHLDRHRRAYRNHRK